MCVTPIHIVNPSTWFDPNGCQSLFLELPCGHCSECIISYRNEWRNRAFYEASKCIIDGNYMLFDTLTYSNGNLPHINDFLPYNIPEKYNFPCFCYDHIRGFFKLLNIHLNRLGYESVRYFVGCEYGDDIRFTRRPHYHILLFVKNSVPVKLLSKEISNCWIYGRTDGIKFRGSSYVLNHNVFTSLSDSERSAVNYVTKYCTKQFSYCDLIENRLNALLAYDFITWQYAKDFIKFGHWQSTGFGNDALIELVGKDRLLNTGKFKVVKKNGIIQYVNLHKSLQRKLLYDYSRDSFGRVHWSLNADGFAYKKKFFYRSVDFLISRIAALYTYQYNEIKNKVIEMFFTKDKINVASSVDELIDKSYNINKGIRNYSSVDYSFIRKRVYTGSDYGSKVDGFKCNDVLKRVRSIPLVGQFITLKDLEKYTHKFSFDVIDNYFHDKSINGDGGLDYLKLMHRLNFIHKNQFAYV